MAGREQVAVRAWHRLNSLVRLGRPKFLLGGIALFGLGNAIAHLMGFAFRWDAYLLGQLAVTATQLMTHYSNDYFDVEADRANRTPTRWSGGSRVLVRGELPRWSALVAALVLILVAWTSTTFIALLPHVPASLALLIFGTMIALSWSYSSPPLRLHSRGLGEPTVALVVPFLTPLSGFLVQAGAIRLLPVLMALPLVLLQLVMLLTLQIPDEKGDRRVGKRTWTVLFGVRPIAVLCSVFIVAAFCLGLMGMVYGLPPSVILTWIFLTPLGAYQLLRYARRDYHEPSRFNRLAFGSVALFFLAILADILGLVLTYSATV